MDLQQISAVLRAAGFMPCHQVRSQQARDWDRSTRGYRVRPGRTDRSAIWVEHIDGTGGENLQEEMLAAYEQSLKAAGLSVTRQPHGRSGGQKLVVSPPRM